MEIGYRSSIRKFILNYPLLLHSVSHLTIPLSNKRIDLLVTILEWLERQDRPGPTDDQPPGRHLGRIAYSQLSLVPVFVFRGH